MFTFSILTKMHCMYPTIDVMSSSFLIKLLQILFFNVREIQHC